MRSQVLESEVVKYQVQVNGQVLTTAQSSYLAESFIASLAPEQQAKARIVPITEGGKQILMG